VRRSLKPIEEQVVVVFGATSGIGREAACRLARRGARVVVAARSETALNTLAEELRREGGEATAAAAEVTEPEQVQAVAEHAVATYGRLDTWVHAAGVGLWASFAQMTPKEWQRVIEVNLNGAVYGAMAALPHLKREGRGALIHVSSAEARLALPLQTAYAASKHGLSGFLKALRLELEHEGLAVQVTEVMPSAINTPLFDKARTHIGTKPVPMRPFYQPSVAAEAILYAAAHPIDEITAGGAGRAGMLLQQAAPSLMNGFLRTAAFPLQRTKEPKGPDAPDNLFQHLEGYDRSEGDFTGESRATSCYTWLSMHPRVRRILAAAAVGAAAVLAGRGRRPESGHR